MNLNNKNIIVTGSNRGIGAEIVKDLHKNGANVYVVQDNMTSN